jgi:hypothetical protein
MLGRLSPIRTHFEHAVEDFRTSQRIALTKSRNNVCGENIGISQNVHRDVVSATANRHIYDAAMGFRRSGIRKAHRPVYGPPGGIFNPGTANALQFSICAGKISRVVGIAPIDAPRFKNGLSGALIL